MTLFGKFFSDKLYEIIDNHVPKVVYGSQARSKVRNYPKVIRDLITRKQKSCGGIGESASLIYLSQNTTRQLKTSDRPLSNLCLKKSLRS